MFDLDLLRTIGLPQPLLPAVLALPHGPCTAPMRVVEIQRERLSLHDGHQAHPGRASAAMLRQALDDEDGLAVGDWVLAERHAAGDWWATVRVPPLNRIVRRDSHGGRRQTLVSNIDTALLVMGLDQDFNLRRLERYQALVRLAGVAAVVVLTKADTCDRGWVQERLAQAASVMPPAEPAIAVNGCDPSARQALAPWLGLGRTLVLLGSSGAGKSTLTHTLTRAPAGTIAGEPPTPGPRTAAVRGGDGRGRHTTTARTLYRCDGGASIIDTPGLRGLRLEADEAQLAAAFDDIARLAVHCRFRDCRHGGEPGCEVRAQVAPERLANYAKLLREARRDTLSAQERSARVTLWKARGREAQLQLRAKRGERS